MQRLYATSLLGITLAAVTIASIQGALEERRHLQDARHRASTLISSFEDTVSTTLSGVTPQRISDRALNRLATVADVLRTQQSVIGISICIGSDQRQFKTLGYPKLPLWNQACRTAFDKARDTTIKAESKLLHLRSRPFQIKGARGKLIPAAIVVAQDVSNLKTVWLTTFIRNALLTALAGGAIFLLIAAQIRTQLKNYILSLRRRKFGMGSKLDNGTSTEAKIHRLPVPGKQEWIQSLRALIDDRNIVVIANREPYIHQKREDRIEVSRPASGLVTALEPILRASGGLWIAHGSGTADRETSNSQGEVAVPPSDPKYTLRRVWLTQEEEEGYYYGFANEGLWPICHLAHTRPTFRLPDWSQYWQVNQKFCDNTPLNVLDDESLILVQDYHFALLPRMLKMRAKARVSRNQTQTAPKISLFWHIPWPNPEAFGICPWGKDLLTGMLGADVVGFHTQYNCNNFLETCDRYLEARVDWERFSVTMDGQETLVRAFPIGIATPLVKELSNTEREELKLKFGVHAQYVAVGVDRLDYTKGLLERVEAVERFLEKNPSYIGKFALAQMGSPSRTHIPAYQALAKNLQDAVDRINERFGSKNPGDPYKPIVLVSHHHEWDDIQYFYQMGDVCMVTSLHDGMNLVAKEYVWCQAPEKGSLILSKFTGASRELTDAFIVNPYSMEEMADAILMSLQLSPEEKAKRMRAMKEKVQGHSAFHWASDLLKALVEDVKVPEVPAAPILAYSGSVPPKESTRLEA